VTSTAEPQTGGETLAGRSDVEHAIGRQALQRPDAFLTQLGVVIVFDDQPVATLGPVDERGPPLGAHHDAGGELMRGGDDDRVGCGAGECADIDAVGVDGNRCHLEAGLLGDQPLRMPAGILERDLANALTGQPAAGQRQPLPEPGADEDMLGLGRDPAHAAEIVRQRVPELGHAAGIADADRIERRLSPRGPD
jgi:hypothetical protein